MSSSEVNQILELADKDFQGAIKTILNKVKLKYAHSELRDMKSHPRNRNVKKENCIGTINLGYFSRRLNAHLVSHLARCLV